MTCLVDAMMRDDARTSLVAVWCRPHLHYHVVAFTSISPIFYLDVGGRDLQVSA